MNPFLQNIASFPTAVFTVLLAVCTLYWLIAVLGLVEIDLLDGDGEGASEVLAGLLMKVGGGEVPLTVVMSFVSLFGWLICYYLVHFLLPFVAPGLWRYLAGAAVFALAWTMGTGITAVVVKPLRFLFRRPCQDSAHRLLGRTAIVRTSRVTENFGEAELHDGGVHLILKVRALPGRRFSWGDRVVLIEYRQRDNCWRVTLEEELIGGPGKGIV